MKGQPIGAPFRREETGAEKRADLSFVRMSRCGPVRRPRPYHPGPGFAAEPLSREGRLASEQIAISGIINDADGSNFRLRHGAGEISVELAGWERTQPADAATLLGIGERVTVAGAADEAFYRARSLDAQTVYLEDRDTFYTTTWSPDGNEPWQIRSMPAPPLYGGRPISIRLSGRVLEVGEDAFALEVGASPVQIDTSEMINSPLDEVGSPAIEIGGWVQVGGTLDDGFFRERRLEALRVTRMIGGETDAS